MELGGGTTLSLVTTGASTPVTAQIESIGGHTITIPAVESVLLAGGAVKKLVGDTVDYGEITFIAHWVGTNVMVNVTTIAEETVTITYANTATVSGTGAISSIKYPDVAVNQGMKAEVTVTWTGTTPPAFTNA